jgi:hypothetical protein
VLFLQEAIFDIFGRTKGEKNLWKDKKKEAFFRELFHAASIR